METPCLSSAQKRKARLRRAAVAHAASKESGVALPSEAFEWNVNAAVFVPGAPLDFTDRAHCAPRGEELDLQQQLSQIQWHIQYLTAVVEEIRNHGCLQSPPVREQDKWECEHVAARVLSQLASTDTLLAAAQASHDDLGAEGRLLHNNNNYCGSLVCASSPHPNVPSACETSDSTEDGGVAWAEDSAGRSLTCPEEVPSAQGELCPASVPFAATHSYRAPLTRQMSITDFYKLAQEVKQQRPHIRDVYCFSMCATPGTSQGMLTNFAWNAQIPAMQLDDLIGTWSCTQSSGHSADMAVGTPAHVSVNGAPAHRQTGWMSIADFYELAQRIKQQRPHVSDAYCIPARTAARNSLGMLANFAWYPQVPAQQLVALIGTWSCARHPEWMIDVMWTLWYVNRRRDDLQVFLRSAVDVSKTKLNATVQIQKGRATLKGTDGRRALLVRQEPSLLTWLFPAGHEITWNRVSDQVSTQEVQSPSPSQTVVPPKTETPKRPTRAVSAHTDGGKVIHAGGSKRSAGRSAYRTKSVRARHSVSLPPASRGKQH
eukprot:TRINITY_DN22555_c0_g1_i2.p1 TRINITY_DN22555_c0_g1~~TRINITY_DN22555_c0_g1_i2.p1  ORF type:complete len:544 (-),score=58.11 TRINITY_DN22555_c0_g1_i2:414-2045(-)